MLINVTHSEESRVAILNDRVLESFEIESLSREHLKGNIYKGVIHRIHPALEAAFVDIGAERDAFLPLDEICFRNLPSQPGLPRATNGDGDRDEDGDGKRPRRRIRDLLKPGQELLVQIAKEQFANKPPTLTTFYSLPGRYLVLLPGSDDTGISRRIEGEERLRLRKLVDALNPPEGFGLIVRTAAGLDEDTTELSRDLTYLQRLWESVCEAAQHKRGPALVYREQDIVLRTIRDLFTPDIDEIHVDNEDVYLRAREFLHNVMPGKEHVLRCYQGDQPIFSAFDLESQIETVFKRRVPLRAGGTIVIDGTEALTAIDVNSGGSMRGPNPEETAYRTNIEAANEVARQMRLRDIGGLIVVDFIDMREPEHIQDVEQTLRTAMKPDKARHEIGRISRLGLLEISRQRMRPAAMATTYTSCPMCDGHGAVRSTESAALVALRKIHNRVALGDVAALRASLPPTVGLYLLNQKRDELARLELRYGTRLQIDLVESLMPHQVEIEVRERAVAPPPPAVAPGSVVVTTPAAASNGNGHADAASGSGKKKRRRRGRKRGGGMRAAMAIGVGLATFGGVEPAPYQPELLAPGTVPPSDEADEFEDAEGPEFDADAGSAATGADLEEAAVSAAPAAPAESGGATASSGGQSSPESAAAEQAGRRGRGRRGGRRRRGQRQGGHDGATPGAQSTPRPELARPLTDVAPAPSTTPPPAATPPPLVAAPPIAAPAAPAAAPPASAGEAPGKAKPRRASTPRPSRATATLETAAPSSGEKPAAKKRAAAAKKPAVAKADGDKPAAKKRAATPRKRKTD